MATARDVFVSYAHRDALTTAAVVRCLETAGWTVWVDKDELLVGQDIDSEVLSALAAAQCVVILWSKSSRSSEYVKAEAREGWARGKLISVCLDGSPPPFPFNGSLWRDLGHWKEDCSDESIQAVRKSVARFVAPGSVSLISRARVGLDRVAAFTLRTKPPNDFQLIGRRYRLLRVFSRLVGVVLGVLTGFVWALLSYPGLVPTILVALTVLIALEHVRSRASALLELMAEVADERQNMGLKRDQVFTVAFLTKLVGAHRTSTATGGMSGSVGGAPGGVALGSFGGPGQVGAAVVLASSGALTGIVLPYVSPDLIPNDLRCKRGELAVCVDLADAAEACSKGDADDCYKIALASHRQGKDELSRNLAALLCKHGHLSGCALEGFVHEQAARRGDPEAAARAARAYGAGCQLDDRSQRNFSECCTRYNNLARDLYQGLNGHSPDMELGKTLMAKACALGVARSCVNRAEVARSEHKLPEALHFAWRGCEGDDARGCLLEAKFLEQGVGAVVDLQKALAVGRSCCDKNWPTEAGVGVVNQMTAIDCCALARRVEGKLNATRSGDGSD